MNPFLGNYLTSDGGTLLWSSARPATSGRVRHRDYRSFADDPRFCDVMPLIEDAAEAAELIAESIRSKPFDYSRQHLKTMKGQSAPFQSLVELASADRQSPMT